MTLATYDKYLYRLVARFSIIKSQILSLLFGDLFNADSLRVGGSFWYDKPSDPEGRADDGYHIDPHTGELVYDIVKVHEQVIEDWNIFLGLVYVEFESFILPIFTEIGTGYGYYEAGLFELFPEYMHGEADKEVTDAERVYLDMAW